MLGRRHARTRHVPLVPPLLVLNEARPGARPSCGSLYGLRRGGGGGGRLRSGSGSFFGLLFSSGGFIIGGSFGSSGGLGGSSGFSLLGALSDGLVLWSSGSGSRGLALLLHGLAWLTEKASQLGGDWGLDLGLGLGLTLGGFTLSSGLGDLFLLLGAKRAEERCSALVLEVAWSGS